MLHNLINLIREVYNKRDCFKLAWIKEENNGWGSKGLDFNSGWNWTPTNHGWVSISKISGSKLSGDVPEKIKPFFVKSELNLLLTSYLCLCRYEIIFFL